LLYSKVPIPGKNVFLVIQKFQFQVKPFLL
jgi:hypothetical protein